MLKRIGNMHTFTCPLCEEETIEPLTILNDDKQVGGQTHAWKCTTCPFIGFEFWNDTNAKDIYQNLTNRNI